MSRPARSHRRHRRSPTLPRRQHPAALARRRAAGRPRRRRRAAGGRDHRAPARRPTHRGGTCLVCRGAPRPSRWPRSCRSSCRRRPTSRRWRAVVLATVRPGGGDRRRAGRRGHVRGHAPRPGRRPTSTSSTGSCSTATSWRRWPSSPARAGAGPARSRHGEPPRPGAPKSPVPPARAVVDRRRARLPPLAHADRATTPPATSDGLGAFHRALAADAARRLRRVVDAARRPTGVAARRAGPLPRLVPRRDLHRARRAQRRRRRPAPAAPRTTPWPPWPAPAPPGWSGSWPATSAVPAEPGLSGCSTSPPASPTTRSARRWRRPSPARRGTACWMRQMTLGPGPRVHRGRPAGRCPRCRGRSPALGAAVAVAA